MARRLNKNLNRQQRYPWDQWLDGATWEIQQGEDFNVEMESMRVQIHNAARTHGFRATTSVKGDKIEFQVHRKPNPGRGPNGPARGKVRDRRTR